MRKISLSLCLLLCVALSLQTKAQSHLITFISSEAPDSIYVENTDESTKLVLNGSDTLHLLDLTASISEISKNDLLKIYPNPVRDLATIDFYNPISGQVSLQLYDMQGKQVLFFNEKLQQGLSTFQLSGLTKGSYVLTIQSGDTKLTSLIVSQQSSSATPSMQLLTNASAANTQSVLRTTKATSTVQMQYYNGQSLSFTAFKDGYTSDTVTMVVTKSQNIIFAFNYPPVADFEANNTDVLIWDTVEFTDISTNNPTAWLWNFGDDSTSILQHPQHIYHKQGLFAVSLTAINQYGDSTVVKADYITVTRPIPETEFTISDTAVLTGDTIQFTDLSTNNPTAWLWNFGDDSTSTLQNPTHIYQLAGQFDVSLTAINKYGDSSIVKADCITVNYPNYTLAQWEAAGLPAYSNVTYSSGDSVTVTDYNAFITAFQNSTFTPSSTTDMLNINFSGIDLTGKLDSLKSKAVDKNIVLDLRGWIGCTLGGTINNSVLESLFHMSEFVGIVANIEKNSGGNDCSILLISFLDASGNNGYITVNKINSYAKHFGEVKITDFIWSGATQVKPYTLGNNYTNTQNNFGINEMFDFDGVAGVDWEIYNMDLYIKENIMETGWLLQYLKDQGMTEAQINAKVTSGDITVASCPTTFQQVVDAFDDNGYIDTLMKLGLQMGADFANANNQTFAIGVGVHNLPTTHPRYGDLLTVNSTDGAFVLNLCNDVSGLTDCIISGPAMTLDAGEAFTMDNTIVNTSIKCINGTSCDLDGSIVTTNVTNLEDLGLCNGIIIADGVVLANIISGSTTPANVYSSANHSTFADSSVDIGDADIAARAGGSIPLASTLLATYIANKTNAAVMMDGEQIAYIQIDDENISDELGAEIYDGEVELKSMGGNFYIAMAQLEKMSEVSHSFL